MIKTLRNVLKADKESFKVPNSVQQTIPIKRLWPDGTFQVGNKFSRTFRFTDINYSVASRDAKLAMFLQYADVKVMTLTWKRQVLKKVSPRKRSVFGGLASLARLERATFCLGAHGACAKKARYLGKNVYDVK